MKIRALILLLCGAALFCLLPAFAHAATLNVPSAAYPTIQSAVDAAQNGDTVLVADGTYTGDGNRDIYCGFSGNNITITSQNGPSRTIIDCGGYKSTDHSGNHRGFSTSGAVTISGFTVKNGYETDTMTYDDGTSFPDGYGGGIYVSRSSDGPTIKSCILSNNTADFGGGISIQNSSATVQSCILTANTADAGGGLSNGSSNRKSNNVTIADCIISDNKASVTAGYYNSGGGVFDQMNDNSGSTFTLQNCTLIGNVADYGGGINNIGFASHTDGTGKGSFATISRCTINGNTAKIGGGILSNQQEFTFNSITPVTTSSAAAITNCAVTGNSAAYGGGIASYNEQGGTTAISNCTISSNTAAKGNTTDGGIGGGVYIDNSYDRTYFTSGGTTALTNCTVAHNSATSGGGIYNDNHYADGSTFALTNCIAYGDTGGENYNATGNLSMVSFCDILGGYTGTGNINKDPLFVNAATGDLHLQSTSPCVGKGTASGAPALDKDGRTRPNPPSIGAYELVTRPTRAVLLIHGTFSDGSTWNSNMAPSLKAHGFIVEAINFPTEPETKSNEAPIEAQGKAIARRVHQLLNRSGQKTVDLVCHSMGGLAARYYLEHQELWQKDGQGSLYSGVSKLVMLGTPNWGLDSPELDPIATIALAHFSSLPGGTSKDRYDDCSPAIREQFAEWEPAPDPLGRGNYSYPNGYRLYSWPLNRGSFSSPIQSVSYIFSDFEFALLDTSGFLSEAQDVYDSEVKFPRSTRQRFMSHVAYYPQIAQTLGVMYPSNIGIHGVGKRLVSPFLYALNQHPIVPGVEFYLIAGDLPLAEVVPHVPYYHSQTVIPGPYVADMENDGVVPTQSAFGIDPLTGQPLFNTIHAYTVNTYHLGLPNNSEVIGHVLDWLSQ